MSQLGVDVGDTFTDVIFHDDETGEVRVSMSEEAARRDYPHAFDP